MGKTMDAPPLRIISWKMMKMWLAGSQTQKKEGEPRQKPVFVLTPLPFPWAHAFLCMCGACLVVAFLFFFVARSMSGVPAPPHLDPSHLFVIALSCLGSIPWINVRLPLECRHVGLP